MEQNASISGKTLKVRICTVVLVAVTALCFFVPDLFFSRELIAKMDMAGCLSWQQVISKGEYYRLVTYLFLHANVEHIANNMLVLALTGDILERSIGHVKFILVYFISGVLAGLTSILYNMSIGAHVSSVGASGAVFGVVGAIAMLLAISKGRMSNMSIKKLVVFVAISIYGGITTQGTDNAAHIGGLIAGAVTALVMYGFSLLLQHIRRS